MKGREGGRDGGRKIVKKEGGREEVRLDRRREGGRKERIKEPNEKNFQWPNPGTIVNHNVNNVVVSKSSY